MESVEEKMEQIGGLKSVIVDGEAYFQIEEVDKLRPFFMSIISPNDHWLFISSNGGLTAGRKNDNFALFPYYTDDKITETAHITGSATFIRVTSSGTTQLWLPFEQDLYQVYHTTRNLYKSALGHKIIFEEINHDLGVSFQYQWMTSERFGFIRKSSITQHSDTIQNIQVLDGIQNILPAGISSDFQNMYSNLADAYKRSELEASTRLGIFALSAIIVDRAEPSEALNANVAWSPGSEASSVLLSSKQVNQFCQGHDVAQESDIKGEKGAYFITHDLSLTANASHDWLIIADVHKNHADIVAIIDLLSSEEDLKEVVMNDVEKGSKDLFNLAAAADGIQLTSDPLKNARHYANVMYNIMRGGIMDDNYNIDRNDFLTYLKATNHSIADQYHNELLNLNASLSLFDLKEFATQRKNIHLTRLVTEYLPLKFSRRHGDPSRPWNKFSINLKNDLDGSKVFDYQGNWRDIFQNWEALSYSYPSFIEGMIFRFLNASTFDGYNPYRLTKDGFDWEIIEPEDPWSYIGYWGDHQIIYLLKLLECLVKHQPNRIQELMATDVFAYAEVPYKIKPYREILKNPKDTVIFDEVWDESVRSQRNQIGADGALISVDSQIHAVNFVEKILATALTKISNFIPEAGIWLNTQRPEWNDANNALVGNGVSMVTLYYLRRFLVFFESIFDSATVTQVSVSAELKNFFTSLSDTLEKHQVKLGAPFNDEDRKTLTDQLGESASSYRQKIYAEGFSGAKSDLTIDQIRGFISLSRKYLEASIDRNRRPDGLYHAYNIISITDKDISISYLSEMLEGQVAVLSSGYLSAQETISLLNSMRDSAIYRHDQSSYILYPNKQLPGFLAKNIIPASAIAQSRLLQRLESDDNRQIIQKDISGQYRFHSSFRNSGELTLALNELDKASYGQLLEDEFNLILNIYEQVFNHKEFTGRSGTFFGYEGLGSIYWHMVSKLLLAVQECYQAADATNESPQVLQALGRHFHEVYEGLGVHKSPELYGAFPTDPYSHTPFGRGAQQPGMTGQVKEDILCRIGELGIEVEEGCLSFNPRLLRREEFLKEKADFHYTSVNGQSKSLSIDEGCIAFTYCQVPIIYKLSDQPQIEIQYHDDQTESIEGNQISRDLSRQILHRSGKIEKLSIQVVETNLTMK